MLLVDLVIWWYLAGWHELALRLWQALRRVAQTFSVPILLRTLFAPWRRIINYNDNSFVEGLTATLDNLVSRFVGFGVRLVVLFTAGIAMFLIVVLGLLAMIIWPILPLAGIVLIIRGLF
jgi:hypothetical protein